MKQRENDFEEERQAWEEEAIRRERELEERRAEIENESKSWEDSKKRQEKQVSCQSRLCFIDSSFSCPSKLEQREHQLSQTAKRAEEKEQELCKFVFRCPLAVIPFLLLQLREPAWYRHARFREYGRKP